MTERWIKSSHSGTQGDCVEVDTGVPDSVPVRDSKKPHGPILTFEPATWNTFLTSVKVGDFDA
ncbi:DUF397 domain-containing protein [Streptomyces sp. HSW2009]|uniref:DUF397 domain-containing protein n=1 Tax=Streptomyces sp. HSW2009 TaxID=3142890 RepID=UPI0032EB293C